MTDRSLTPARVDVSLLVSNVGLVLALFIVRAWAYNLGRKSTALNAALVVLVKARDLWRRQHKGFDVEPEWKRFSDKLTDPDWIESEADQILADHNANR